MSKESLPKIFEPFFTTYPDGSGLGLAIVYKIIKEHGGDIQVMSEPGQGSTFEINFPAIPPPVSSVEHSFEPEKGDGARES
jgi:signal transduction histidine kinase